MSKAVSKAMKGEPAWANSPNMPACAAKAIKVASKVAPRPTGFRSYR